MGKSALFYSLLFCLLLWGATTALKAQIQFTDVTAASGVSPQFDGEGVAVLDANNDGWEDFFVADAAGNSRLYLNLGNWQFQDATTAAGLSGMGPARLVLAGDYDNDGWTDLFVGGIQSGAWLWRNNGDGTFTDVTDSCGITYSGDVRGGAWCDFDANGLLDLYIADLTQPNRLYRNNGDGTFSETAAQAGARGPVGPGLVMGLSFLDYDRDGDADLWLAQDGHLGNVLLRREANGTFTDVSQAAGVVTTGQGMGVAAGDYDRDGDFDVYITNLDLNALFQNQGDGTFLEVAAGAGVTDAPQSMGWGTFFFDADNDGWLDIFNNNQSGFAGVPNSLFHNLGDGTFEEVSQSAGVRSFNDGIGCAYSDLDNDGDLDLIVAGKSAPQKPGLILYRNDSPFRNWIGFRLQESAGVGQAVGAVVALYAGGGQQWAQVSAGSGYVSQNSLRLHFGLDTIQVADSVVVFWPDGARETFQGLAVNQYHQLVEGGGVTGLSPGHETGQLPRRFRLEPVYPNPFNPATTITYRLAQRARVDLSIYSATGRRVQQLVHQVQGPGRYRVVWQPATLASGIYFVQLTAGSFRDVQRAVLLK